MSVSFSLSSSWNNEAAAPLSLDVSVTNTVFFFGSNAVSFAWFVRSSMT